ncbi:MAG: TIGR04552 family protein [Vulcanimicrobiota bacterium]
MPFDHGLGAQYEFSWEILRLFLEGFSPIDLTGLPLASHQEAIDFLAPYGYDMTHPEDRAVVDEVHQEAVAFIERFLCPGIRDGDLNLVVPPQIANPDSVLDLLVRASDTERDLLAQWSCAVLRVMHTISHANRAMRTPYYEVIKDQILGRFQEHIATDDTGQLRLGKGEGSVALMGVFYKEQKSRSSLILKLLHKPDNVASEVYDRMGVKMITQTKVEALLALKYLRKNNLVSVPHITPGRSRNTLVNLDSFRSAYEALTRLTRTGNSTEEHDRDLEFARQMEHRPDAEARDVESRIENPFTSPTFRSIQFTCRHLVRVPNPTRSVVDRMRARLNDPALLEELTRDHPREVCFYFPYEVQITDHDNYLQSLNGESSHTSYKRRQLRAARKRILGEVIQTTLRRQSPPAVDGVSPCETGNCAGVQE